MIDAFRLALKMSQEELAEVTKLDMETIQSFEEYGFPGETDVHTIHHLSKALKVSVDTLVYFNHQYA
ncbi:XRE family transcriptional regulator [Salicibibacter halophilus]|uniref:XRE family transcriptional regulator n=1 Tax=Salicibibacter halophilus TaxID=2502791 RepID=A0A514LH17_9BACI|nr:helix-turn-helix transcriptional regulator [Salicibibacter halophilus]QDI90835.1 XRE family transcriptional regulator [Salicibibacter halophilus]